MVSRSPAMDARNVILDTFGDEYEIHKSAFSISN